jgi:hypothetical protein
MTTDPAVTIPDPPPPRVRSRVVVSESLFHQVPRKEPTAAAESYSRWLDSDDSPYVRPSIRATEEWAVLDVGWVQKVGMLHVKNAGPGTLRLASGDEPGWVVFPGETIRGVPGGPLRVRSEGGDSMYSVTVIPA